MINIFIILFYTGVIYLLIAIFEKSKLIKPGEKISPGDGNIIRSFSWQSNGLTKNYLLRCEVLLNEDTYQQAAASLVNDDPGKTKMFSAKDNFSVAKEEISHNEFGSGSNAVGQVVNYLKEYANSEFLSTYELTNIILSFVHEQCIKYEYDKNSTGYDEYFRYPVETIYDQVGDCDCKSILGCSIFKAFKVQVAFVIMPGHAAVAITFDEPPLFANITMNGKPWFYCESTGDNWRPGQLPEGIDINSVELQEI